MSALLGKLDAGARAGRFNGLTLYVTKDGRWQASLRSRHDVTSWTVRIGDTPSDALAQLFDEAPVTPPPGEGLFD